MFNSAEFEIALIRANLSKVDFAKKMGFSLQTLYNKISNNADFKACEISVACKILKLSNKTRDKIFFANNVDGNNLQNQNRGEE